MSHQRFLLIRAWGCGFWSAMEHVSGQLLIAELANRIPVIYWGAESLYAADRPLEEDAFTMYFLPVSNYSIEDIENVFFTYFPTKWKYVNVRYPVPITYLDLLNHPQETLSFFNRTENVLVSQLHTDIHLYKHLINESHPAYGLDFHDIHRYFYQKYFKLQSSLEDEIEQFYQKHMKDRHPILGVHVRGSDKIRERPHLHQLNASYTPEIENYMNNNPTASIFLLTDSEAILASYKNKYGDRIINTDSIRTLDDRFSVHYDLNQYSKRQKGIDVLKDTYLALKCDHFIGAIYSNVSLAIFRLKNWPEGSITLIPE